ncbi:hypothetical protein SOVF_214110, partial [Spinacia oleracea]
VDANVGAPQFNYHESSSKVVEIKYLDKKQSGGSGYEFVSEIKGGLEECMSNGVQYTLQDFLWLMCMPH